MSQTLLLVDFENVHQVDLDQLDENSHVIIFVGSNQKNIPIELVMSAQKLGQRMQWQRIEGNGSNALDFYIACQLGRVIEKSPGMHCIILSKDKGFDPLLRYLNQNGLKCERIESLSKPEPAPVTPTKAATPAKTATPAKVKDANFQRVFELLRKTEDKVRPRKHSTLSRHISAIFRNNIAQEDVDEIIGMLLRKKMIYESNDTITYLF